MTAIEKINEYNETKEELKGLLLNILDKGEITEDETEELEYLLSKEKIKYEEVKTFDLEEVEIKEELTKEKLVEILTNGGQNTLFSIDDEGNVTMDGTSLPQLKVIGQKLNFIATDGDDESSIVLTPEFIEMISKKIVLKADQVTIDGNLTVGGAINSNSAAIKNLKADVGAIGTLVNGNLTSDNIHSLHLTAENCTIVDGFIKNAMIQDLTANKITSGNINTNNVKIQSEDGSLILTGNLQQFKDENGKVRIQIGKDNKGNFTFILYDANGKGVLLDSTGIKASAISDGLIVDKMIGDNANISGGKLDINSVVSSINGSTSTLKSSKIYLDDKKQTLDISFKEMNNTVEKNKEQLKTNKTDLAIANGKIQALIENTTVIKDGQSTTLKEEYSKITSNLNGITQQVKQAESKVEKVEDKVGKMDKKVTAVDNKFTSLETNLSGITQKVEHVETTTSELTDKINNVQNTANNNKNNLSSLTSRVSTAESKLTKDALTTTIGSHYTTSGDVNGLVSSKGYQTQTQVQQTVDKLQMKFTSSGGYNLLLNTSFKNGLNSWGIYKATVSVVDEETSPTGKAVKCVATDYGQGIYQNYKPNTKGKYTLTFYAKANDNMTIFCGQESSKTSNFSLTTEWQKFSYTFDRNSLNPNSYIFYSSQAGTFYIHSILVEKGEITSLWSPNPNEIHEGITSIDKDGIIVSSSNVKSKTSMNADGFKITKTDTNEDVFKVNSDGTLSLKGNITLTGGSVPTSNLKGTISANQLASNSVTADKLHANAINGKTITGSHLRGGTFYTAPNSNETEGYAFRIYSDGRVYSKNTIQVYGQAGNGEYAQLKDGTVTATEYIKTGGYKTEKPTLRWGINDAEVVNPSGDNANRLEFTTINDLKYFRPNYNGTVRNGSSSYPWFSVYSKNGVSTTSDRTCKENIRYITENNNEVISKEEMLNFIMNDYILAQYNYIGEDEEKISAIAQDLLIDENYNDNKIGQMIVNNSEALKLNREGEESKLSINQTQLLNVVIGALQKAVERIEELEKKIK